MAKIYASPVEYIKEHLFSVWVPAYYQTAVPAHLKDPTPKPFERINPFKMVDINRISNVPLYQPLDPDQPQRARHSIETMIDMFRKKVVFELEVSDDVILILDAIDRYLISLVEDIKMKNEYVIEYARLVCLFREEIYKVYFRFMKLNPGVLANLYRGGQTTNNLSNMLSHVGEKNVEQFDPLRARMDPPIDIDALIPKDAVITDNVRIETTLGIPTMEPYDTVSTEFKLDEFLQGR